MNLSPTLAAVRRRLLHISLGVGIGTSLVNSFTLQLIYAYFIENNVKFEAISTPFRTAISFLHIAALFVGYAVMIYGTFSLGEKASRCLLFANLIQICTVSLASLGVSYFTMTPALFLYNLGTLLLYLFLNLLVYLALLTVIRIAAVLIARRTAQNSSSITLDGQFVSFRHPLLCAAGISTLIYIGSAWMMCIIETTRDLMLYGLPVNTEEWVYLVTPHVELAAYFFIGYTVTVAVCYWLQDQCDRIAACFSSNQ